MDKVTQSLIAVIFVLLLVFMSEYVIERQDVAALKSENKELRSEVTKQIAVTKEFSDKNARLRVVIDRLEGIKGVTVASVSYYAPTGNNTATGVAPKTGETAAVDPTLIPLGSEVYIQGEGWLKAEDTVGYIKGA